jgi:hypothetical protein
MIYHDLLNGGLRFHLFFRGQALLHERGVGAIS